MPRQKIRFRWTRRFAAVVPVVLTLGLAPVRAAVPPHVAADGKLTVLYADLDTPFLRETSDGPEGFDYEVLAGFARLEGLELEPVPMAEADELIPALLAGRGELIAGGFTRTDDRASRVLFTGEVTPQRFAVVTAPPTPVVASREQLAAMRVGTVGGTSWEGAARAAGVPDGNLATDIPLDRGAMREALASSRVDALVTGLFTALLLRQDDPTIEIGILLGDVGYHAYATAPADAGLRDALDAYLAGIRETPGWYRLVVQHFGEDAPDAFRRARTGS